MQRLAGLDHNTNNKQWQSPPPHNVKLYTLFDNQVAPATFPETDLRALGVAMSGFAMRGSSAMAGYTYLGQFLAHDLSRLRVTGHDRRVKSFDTDVLHSDVSASLDLDSVYGSAKSHSTLRQPQSAYMKLGYAVRPDGGVISGFDLPRDALTACIAEDRNDENLLVAQLHLQFLRLHNVFVDRLKTDFHDHDSLFNAARDLVVQHYQYVILYDFLYEILHPAVWRAIVFEGRSILWDPDPGDEAVLPIEYSAAAGRFGHSMVRESYDLNGSVDISLDDLFVMTGAGGFGGKSSVLPVSYIPDWLLYFPFPTVNRIPRPKRNLSRRISPRVRVVLKNIDELPRPEDTQLAIRNLLRGQQMRLASGQAIARYVQGNYGEVLEARRIPLRVLSGAALQKTIFGGGGTGVAISESLFEETPLWFYLLAESCLETHQGIGKLGPLGSLIVAETIMGLLKLDRQSVLNRPASFNSIKGTKIISEASEQKFLQMSDLILAGTPGLPDPVVSLMRV